MKSQFNAIDYSQQLQAVGVSRTQAEMHAKLLSKALANCAATRGDLAELRTELTARMAIFETRIVGRMEEFEATVKLELAKMRVEIADMRTEMRSELASIRSEMRSELASVRSEMRSELASIRSEIANMRSENKYNRRMMSFLIALQIAVIVKMFFP